MEAAMELELVENGADKKMSFYTKGTPPIDGDHFNLLGFKENYPVLESTLMEIKYISLIKSQREIDKEGQQFYNWKGRIIKIVPPGQIPKAVREQTIKLKTQGTTTNAAGAKARNPVSNYVRGVKHVNIDKDLNIPCTNKDLGQITKPSDRVIHSSTAESSGFPVNPPIVDPTVLTLNDPSALISRVDSNPAVNNSTVRILPAIGSRATKLLSKKNLTILNQAKMKALNLSMKAIKDEENGKEIGVQTDQVDTKQFSHQQVQTDLSQHFSILDYMTLNLENLIDINTQDESPIINDVRLDNGFNCIPNHISTLTQNSAHGKQTDDKKLLTMKMMFFHDLRECMTYNAAGNLPLHEGVLKNDLVAVKRQCAALKARKCGVNLGNHDGCTPLQLAIVNNVQVDIVFILLDSGGDLRDIDGDGNNILHLGAKFERLGAMQMMLNHCSFMSCFDCINSFNFEGLTPLMICCVSSWTEGALLLIDREASVNLRDQRSGKTALFHAAEVQNVEIVRALLQNGADPKLKNFFGTSPHDAMYELDDMDDSIKRLIFGITKKRSNVEAEMNPNRTAKAAKQLKTYRKFQKIKIDTKFPMYTLVQK